MAQVGLEDAIHTALLTLKEGFEGQLSSSNIEVGIVGPDKKFRVLTESEVSGSLTMHYTSVNHTKRCVSPKETQKHLPLRMHPYWPMCPALVANWTRINPKKNFKKT